MSEGKRRTSALGVSLLAALALTAFTASGAQAAEWTVGGKTLEELGITQTPLLEISFNVLMFLPGLIQHCASKHSTGVVLRNGVSHEVSVYNGCVLLGTFCKLSSEEIKIEADAKLSSDAMYAIYEPANKKSFGSITIEQAEEEECLLIKAGATKETLSLTGSFAALVGTKAVKPTLTFSSTIDTAAGAAGIKLGSNKMTLEVSSTHELTGEFKGKELGAIK